ncbi:hypothetical protein DJ568_15420 [Mucilaginibacter hurinus]|uniref:HTH cro/C1-type domain-containing protein n=1 Tax=Mucilaginibacter hurinus TaxID=2201324 RepID=A0A367GKC1_9SPHI|nr:helix-turn-helix transcriptional regulator [Mucilaginibacter hurinus]RCH53927.1 hypothetical protein DJ568_15420 [Mucilaginibacter hurinus]
MTDLKNIIAQNIKARRDATGLKQEAFAAEVGATQKSLSHYEKARCLPTIDRLISIARYTGVTVDWLLQEH